MVCTRKKADYYGYDLRSDTTSYISLSVENGITNILYYFEGIKKEDIQSFEVISGNDAVFVVNNYILKSSTTGTYIDIIISSKPSAPKYALEWLFISMQSKSKTELKDSIGVIVYPQLILSDVYLYAAEDDLSPNTVVKDKNKLFIDKTELLNKCNTFFKQAVSKLNSIKGVETLKIQYDLNKNGCLDKYDGSPLGNPEFDILRESLNNKKADPEKNGGIALVQMMAESYSLYETANSGQNIIRVYCLRDAKFIVAEDFYLGTGSTREIVSIKAKPMIDEVFPYYIATLKLAKPLKFVHYLDETLYQPGAFAGVAFSDNNAYTIPQKGIPEAIIAHEILHFPAFGSLHDVGVNDSDCDNLMYYSTKNTGDYFLKFREINNVITRTNIPDGNKETQWDKIQGYAR